MRDQTGDPDERVHTIGALSVSFNSDDIATRNRLRALYDAFGFSDSASSDAIIDVRVDRHIDDTRDASAYRWVGTINGAPVRSARHLVMVEDVLTRRLNRLVLDAEDDRLHLHAGAVHRNGATVLVVGTSGSGKSTLVAALVANGWHYLSDEQLGVLPDARLVPYPRPITLRRGSWTLLDMEHAVDPAWPDFVERMEIPPADLGVSYNGPPTAPTMIVCPNVHEAAGSSPMTASETIAALLADTMDLERAGTAGFDALVALTTTAPAWRVTGPDLKATIELIDRMANADVDPPQCTAFANPVAGRTGAGAWLFDDDTAVVYDNHDGQLVSLDRAGFDTWKLAIGPRAAWPDQLAGSAFLHSLIEAGVINIEGDIEGGAER